MTERERFESWARQRWTHPEDFDQRIKAPSKYNNYEAQAAWEAWQEKAAQPVPSTPEGWKLVPIEPTPSMKTAGIGVEVYQDSPPSTDCLTWEEVGAIYAAMLAAAPKPEAKP